nr:hypothetical protein [Tanacetum cinerariifolium]
VQNFEIQFLKEAAKFVGDFKSLAKEADSSLVKHKILELDIERLLKAVKLKNANVELEFQVFNYAKENAHFKATYKNLFDSISVTRAHTETKIASLQNELQCNIYKNAKLRTQLFKKVFDAKENIQDLSKNTKFAKQPIAEILPKIGETNALSKPVTSNSVSTPQVSKGVNNDKVIAPEMFRISPDKVSREAKKVPNTVSASSRTKPITVLQPSIITKKGMNSNSNEPKGMNNDKVIAPGMFRISPDKIPRKAKKVPNTLSASARTKPITVSQPSVITKKGMNSDLNGFSSTGVDNIKTRRPQPRSNIKNDIAPSASKSSRSMNKDVKVEEHHRNFLLSKKNKHSSSACNNSKIDSLDVISKVVCAICKLVAPSGDNACTSNTMEPKIKRFPNSTSLLSRLSIFVYGASTQVVPST